MSKGREEQTKKKLQDILSVFDLPNNKHNTLQQNNTCNMFDFRKWLWDRIKHKIEHRITDIQQDY